jgi:small-conductance mechanosensitive channel
MNFSLDQALRILSVLIAALASQWLVRLILRKFQRTIKQVPYESIQARRQRIRTLVSLISTTATLVINLIAVLLILTDLGFNILPILTGIGFLGLAFGLGARALIADLIAGFFILLENQYNVGDEVELAPKAIGKVSKISLRTTILKDKEGVIYIVPNSAIRVVTKFPKKTKH